MKKFKYVIVGGGIVAGYAAQEFINHPEYSDGDLAIITDDDAIPYERPPLSKDFLAGEENYEDIQINSPDFYHQNGIRLYLYTHVDDINTVEKTVKTDHGDIFSYEKLLLATGSRAIELDIPGGNNSLIKYLRTIDDARAIRDNLTTSNDVIVVGGGYIGMEVASSLAQDNHRVTMIFPEDRLMERLFTPELSAFFEELYTEHNVTFIKNAEVISFSDIPNKRIQATLSNGQTVSADLVVAGIGAKPNLQIMKNSRIHVDEGVVLNNRLESSIENVYAAGDIANYYDLIFEKRRRVEHWQNAVDTAEFVAREMLGIEQEDFKTLRYFFSDVFDLSYEFWGDNEDADQVIHTGDFDKGSVGVWWLKSNKIVAALLMGRSDTERQNAQRWIKEQRTIQPEILEQSLQTSSG